MNKQDRDCIETMHNYMLGDDNYLHGDRAEINHICSRLERLSQLEDILKKYDMNSLIKLSIHLGLLRELTDIKNEVGFDLVKLFTVLKNGIYDKQGKYHYPHLEFVENDNHGEWILVEERGDYRSDLWFHFKDYGKTWTLEKENLL